MKYKFEIELDFDQDIQDNDAREYLIQCIYAGEEMISSKFNLVTFSIKKENVALKVKEKLTGKLYDGKTRSEIEDELAQQDSETDSPERTIFDMCMYGFDGYVNMTDEELIQYYKEYILMEDEDE